MDDPIIGSELTGPIGGETAKPCERHCFHAVERPDCRIPSVHGKNCEPKCCKCGEGHWG